MTENEIIEILQAEKACVTRAMKNECNRDCYNCDLCEEGKDILTVYDVVINALDEIEQYRAIGLTPTKIYEKIGGLDVELGKYHSIGTIGEFKALKEKSVAKKVKGKHMSDSLEERQLCGEYALYGHCPNCGENITNLWNSVNCGDCGQKLDWK